MITIDIVRLILAPESLSILLYYFIPGYLFFTFIRFKEFFGLREKWKILTGLDIIIFSIVLSLLFSLNFVLIFYAFLDFNVVVLSMLGMILVQLPIHYFEKSNKFKLEYAYLLILTIAVTFLSENFFAVESLNYMRVLSPSIGIVFFLLMFKIIRFKLMETLRPESKNLISFW